MFVVPKFQAAGWDDEPHSIAEQRTITDGRIVPVGQGFVRWRAGMWRRGRVALFDADIDAMEAQTWAQCLRPWTTRRQSSPPHPGSPSLVVKWGIMPCGMRLDWPWGLSRGRGDDLCEV
jgi:hypothetical protein